MCVWDPALHGMAIAALLGKLECEEDPTVDPDSGRLRERDGQAMANPLARQVMNDLWHLAQCEVGEAIWEMLDERPMRLFEGDVAKVFLAVGVTVLRARALSEAEPPPGHCPPGFEPPAPEEEEGIWECPIVCAAGSFCRRRFASQRALLQHIRHSDEPEHKLQSASYALTVTNECPWCGSTFVDHRRARHHTARLFAKGSCVAGVSVYHTEPIVPPTLSCPVPECAHIGAFGSLEELHWHIRSHSHTGRAHHHKSTAQRRARRWPRGH